MGSIKAITAHKGPWAKITVPRKGAKRRKGNVMKSWKIWTWGAGALIGVMVVAVIGVTAWGFIKGKIDAARAAAPEPKV
jgi:hypothetical protein